MFDIFPVQLFFSVEIHLVERLQKFRIAVADPLFQLSQRIVCQLISFLPEFLADPLIQLPRRKLQKPEDQH